METCPWCRSSTVPDSGTMPWLVKCLYVDRFAVLMTVPRSFNISLLQFGRRFFKTRISRMQYKFICETLRLFLGSKKSKWNMPVICCKKKNKHSKYRAFLILSFDKLRSHLQSHWLINWRSKLQHYNQASSVFIQKRDKTQNQWIYANNAFSAFTKSYASLVSRVGNKPLIPNWRATRTTS